MRNGFGAPCVNATSSCIHTCRRSASPRATGLGTGTEGAAGAPPSPVRPWSPSSKPRDRDKYHRKPHLHSEEVVSSKANSVPLPSAIQNINQQRTHWYTSWYRIRPSSKKKNKIKISFLPPVTMQLYFSSHWGNRSKMFIRQWVGVAPLFCDSWRATGCLSLTPASSLPELHMDALTANV